jgi:hypothetical protein
MKRITSLFLALFMAPFAVAGFSLFAQDKDTKTFAVSKGGTFELDTKAGEVAASVWDKNEISVTVEYMENADKQYLSMTQTGNNVRVSFQPPELRPRNRIQFRLSIPAEFNLDLRTGGGKVMMASQQSIVGKVRILTGGGEIEIGDVNGDVNLHTGGGDIQTGALAGNADLSAGGGNVRCGFISGAASIRTGGGNIASRGAAKDLNISTGGGAINIEEAGANAIATTGGGNLSVNKSFGKLTLSTGGGAISVRNANGDLSVTTGGGNLTFENVTGSINGHTGAGGINAEISPVNKDTSLETGAGDIDLGLPASAKATVLARIESRMPHDESDITSEFGAPEKGSSNHEKTFLTNGGGPRIILETKVGKIRIRKTT